MPSVKGSVSLQLSCCIPIRTACILAAMYMCKGECPKRFRVPESRGVVFGVDQLWRVLKQAFPLAETALACGVFSTRALFLAESARRRLNYPVAISRSKPSTQSNVYMRRCADLTEQAKKAGLKFKVDMLVTPGSELVRDLCFTLFPCLIR